MESEYRNRNKKSYIQLRMVYDFTMASLILGVGIILLFGNKFGLPIIGDLDSNIRYGFGALCLFYGSFRFYRGIKHDY
ncbi:MAG: hypothetical protein JST21_08050 [Bacteroidetes bacterium]|nr:hypothetical protein [Bacteroidota bacterium]